ncbi:MAG: ABC transporter permease [Mesorhizobium sp.]|nr:MAG: ABC transporter permease [Mesorhizobium sp.]
MRRPGESPLGFWLVMAPALLLSLICFGIPALFMARMSLNGHEPMTAYVSGFTFEHYRRLLSDPLIARVIWNTARLALVASILTVVLAYAFALLVWMRPARWRFMFVGLALLPMLISEIAIIFGWWTVFPKNGLLSYILVSTGVTNDKISLMYTEGAALVGLVYVTLPYCFFILLSVFDGIDRRTLEAASDLGAPPLTTFWEVILPQTRIGLFAAFAQAFIWTIGVYATPLALGPDTLWTLGYLIQDQMMSKHHWPMAATLSMVLIVGVGGVIVVLRWLQPAQRSFHV